MSFNISLTYSVLLQLFIYSLLTNVVGTLDYTASKCITMNEHIVKNVEGSSYGQILGIILTFVEKKRKNHTTLRWVIPVVFITYTEPTKYVLDIQSELNYIIKKWNTKYQLHVLAIILAIIRLYSTL
jgi:hypothetical protein